MERIEYIDQDIDVPLSAKDYDFLNKLLRRGEIYLSDLDPRLQQAYIDELQKKLTKQYPVNE